MAASSGSLRPHPPFLRSAISPPSSSSSSSCSSSLGMSTVGSSSFSSPARRMAVRRVASPAKAYVAVEKAQEENKDLYALAADASAALLGFLWSEVKERKRRWELHAETMVENGIVGCRFFALIGVAGTLVGSILCFVEGCFLVWAAFLHRYYGSWERLEQAGEVMTLLIEATESFLVGSAMLYFGMGLYTMFTRPPCMEMERPSEAKAELGRAVVMLLQTGLVEKFKSVPLTNGLDLACFAASIFFSSAGIFLLSRLRHRRRIPAGEELGVST
ncbi:unnamed protein product [Spirodela intermedia]|uniref:Uncharacterized protein n=1 Tax=Spirodela intermedia TaxID=51605 RepID=A0A7I8I7A8_SPIIN|nr:unnamed protein product [Spirodela intermedia]CAA6653447.1 unnamed protein product [Spirodela intermedia]